MLDSPDTVWTEAVRIRNNNNNNNNNKLYLQVHTSTYSIAKAVYKYVVRRRTKI